MVYFMYILDSNCSTLLHNKTFSSDFIGLQIFFSLVLIYIGFLGLSINQKSLISTLLAIELTVLGVSYMFICFSKFGGALQGQIIPLLLLALAGSESSLGIALLVMANRLFGNIHISSLKHLKG